MKFLCVACDEPMKLEKAEPPDERGSLRVLYECPECFTQMAMLTNPMETQAVSSLGVKIGPGAAESAVAAGASVDGDGVAKCPFSGMLSEMEAQATASDVTWSPEALARLQNIPEFVRPMAKQGIESMARANGQTVIDESVLDQARGQFGM